MSEVRQRSKSVSFLLEDVGAIVYPETTGHESADPGAQTTAGVAFIDSERTALFLACGPDGLFEDVAGPLFSDETPAAAARRIAQEQLELPIDTQQDFNGLLVEAVHLCDDNHTCFLLQLPLSAASSSRLVRVPLLPCKVQATAFVPLSDGPALAPRFAEVVRRSAVIDLCAAREAPLLLATLGPMSCTSLVALSADMGSLTAPSSAADSPTPSHDRALWWSRLSEDSADAAANDEQPADCMPCVVM